MAGSPPKSPPPTMSSSSSNSPPTLAAGSSSSSSPKPPPPNYICLPHWPWYEELTVSYLRPRVVSGTKVDFIHEVDLYSADPDQLTENYTAVGINRPSAWFFFTPLHPKGSGMKRNVDNGRKGTWVNVGCPKDVLSDDKVIGKRRGFAFEEKVGDNYVKTAWRMTELRLNPNPNPNEGGQEAASSDLLALCEVYRSLSIRIAKKEGEGSTAVAKADAEAPAAAAVVTPGPKGADEEIGADTAAGPGRKRKAGDEDSGAEPEQVASSPGRQNKPGGESADAAKTGEIFADNMDALDAAEKAAADSGAETVASTPGRQNKPGGESADAAKTGEIFADSKDALDAAEKTAADSGAETVASSAGRQNRPDGEIESADAAKTGQIFPDGKDPLDAAEKAQQEEPRIPRDNRTYNFFDGTSAPLDAPEEAEQEPRDPQFYKFI